MLSAIFFSRTHHDHAAPIRRAAADDKAQVCITLATAFAVGPVAEWLVPDSVQRLPLYLEYASARYDHALAHGVIHTTPSHAGAAVWFANGSSPYGSSPYGSKAYEPAQPGGQRHSEEAFGRIAQLDAILAELQPAKPHHQLALLGVDPLHQRRGLGSALLRHHHRALDSHRIPAFLVATTAGSRDLYLRHGYLIQEKVTLPDGPPLWAMWRTPGS